MTYKINTVIEKDMYGYYAYSPDLKWCHFQGDTLEKVIENIKEIMNGAHLSFK